MLKQSISGYVISLDQMAYGHDRPWHMNLRLTHFYMHNSEFGWQARGGSLVTPRWFNKSRHETRPIDLSNEVCRTEFVERAGHSGFPCFACVLIWSGKRFQCFAGKQGKFWLTMLTVHPGPKIPNLLVDLKDPKKKMSSWLNQSSRTLLNKNPLTG